MVAAALAESEIDLPRVIKAHLATQARQIAWGSLKQAAEGGRITEKFGSAGIDRLFVKGVTLERIAYGNLSVKQAWDIDLLISPSDVAAAYDALIGLDYRPSIPAGASREDVELWHRFSKETVWRKADGTAFVELHTRLVNNESFLTTVGMDSPRQDVKLSGGLILQTLATDHLFAYLCVHGGTSGWRRLKWIADVAALASQSGAEPIEVLHAKALELGAERSADQAVLLAHNLLALPVGDELLDTLRRDPINRYLLRTAQNQLLGKNETQEAGPGLSHAVPVRLSCFFIGRGLRYHREELLTQLAVPEARLRYRLPKLLAPIYPLLHLLTKLRRK